MNNEKYISVINAGSHDSASTLGFNKDHSTIESTLDDSNCDLRCGNSTTSMASDDLVKHLSKQAELYRSGEKEEEKSLVKNAIQNYLREIFRSVKFSQIIKEITRSLTLCLKRVRKDRRQKYV